VANYLTQQDVENYGSELLDVSQRAALQAIAPHLQQTESHLQQLARENADLRARQAREQRRRLDQQVEQAIPNYRDFDHDPRWHQWLKGVDLMSGRVRQQLLNEAIQHGNVSRVLSFFNGFQQEAGGSPQAQTVSGRRARSSSNKPIYTRAQVAQLYSQHRRGAYAGREAEWQRQEADIIRAGAEGRIVGGTDIWGK
jgi:hypothetical protein